MYSSSTYQLQIFMCISYIVVIYKIVILDCCSVPKLCLPLRHHGLQHARLPYPFLPGFAQIMSTEPVMPSNHLTLCCLLLLLPSCLQSFPASASFPVNQLFASGGQSIGASASASVLPVNIHG